MLETGSEFIEVATLEPLWEHHKHWHKMKEIVTTGLTYPLTDLPETDRKGNMYHMIQHENHKLAQRPQMLLVPELKTRVPRLTALSYDSIQSQNSFHD